MMDHVRAQDPVPRTVRDRNRERERHRQFLRSKLKREPTLGELATRLGMATSELATREGRDVVGPRLPFHTGDTAWISAPLVASEPQALRGLLREEVVLELQHAIAALPPVERSVVDSTWLNDEPLAQVGRRLGVTISRVSQLRRQALERLRKQMNRRGYTTL